MMAELSTWLGVLAYSLSSGLCVVWIGISLANWVERRSMCSALLGFGAGAWGIFFIALIIIASDAMPKFSGVYVAISIRLSAIIGTASLIAFTILYLRRKYRQQVDC